ncbi:MAG: FAD-binding protein [Alphaproteobacteria bacterium]|nr:FAD-binding protein [Alphaproteobacteria bacterium]
MWDRETGVLVIGAGACGLAAALAAHQAGATVELIEKQPLPGGNLLFDDDVALAAAGTALQRTATVTDDAASFAADLLARAEPHDMEPLAHRLADISSDLVDWLGATGVRLGLDRAPPPPGHRATRLHLAPSRAALREDLLRALEQRGIALALGHGAVGLVGDDERVGGAVIEPVAGGMLRLGARCVVLATGGFGNAPGLVGRFCADVVGRAYAGAPGATGDAILWGGGLGAALGNLGAYQTHPTSGALLRTQGGLVVDDDGRVQRRDGFAINGLYAGGGAAAGISGKRGGAGYLAGTALLCALGLGMLAGRAAAAETQTTG